MMSKRIKIGISPIGWSNDDLHQLGGDIPFQQCIEEMHKAGYAGCEIGHKFPRSPDELKQAIEPLNLQIASAWFSCRFTEEDCYQETVSAFSEHLQFLKAMGAKLVVVCETGQSIYTHQHCPVTGKRKPTLTQQQWRTLIDGLHHIGEMAREQSLCIAYHHHMGTAIQTFEEITQLMASTLPELVSLVVDTGHLVYADADPVRLICQQGLRVKHVHLKDIRMDILRQVKQRELSFLDSVMAGVFTVPGDGSIDFFPVFEALDRLDYQGWLIVEAEQDPAQANPLEYAHKGRQFIQSMLGKVHDQTNSSIN
jgi:inosose dehydratase